MYVVIDNLHVFLRVLDILTDLLIVELKRQDCIEKVISFEIQTFGYISELCLISYTWVYQFFVGKNLKDLK